IPKYLVGGMWNQPYETKVVTAVNSLDNYDDQNTLVRIDNVHFDTPCETWGDVANQTSANRNLRDANGQVIVVRTSNYALFANALIPASTGSVIGVFQIYGSTKQLMIRDLNDVLMTASPCSTGPVGTGALMNIGAVRSLYSGMGTTFIAGTKIRGVVITDKTANNITSQNLILQDGLSGIVARF